MKIEEATIMYISYRMSLGERARTLKFIMNNFCNYIGPDKDISNISEQHCLYYLNAHGIREGVATAYWFSMYAILNGFFMWAIARKYMKANPLPKDKPAKNEGFVPYIYSNEELKRIFETALTYRKRFNIEYPEVIQTMLKLTYCLGLRPSETTHLVVDDIRLQDGIAFIRETKFYKSRIVPFGEEVSRMLEDYLLWRSEITLRRCVADNHLFIVEEEILFGYLRSSRLSDSSGKKLASIARILLSQTFGFKIFGTPLQPTVSPNGIEMGRMCKHFCRYCLHTWDTAILIVRLCISPSQISY